MRVLKIYHRGSGYGRVLTDAEPEHHLGDFIRLESAALPDLAQLAADVLGDEQPLLPPQHQRNLARWILRHGCERWGERPFHASRTYPNHPSLSRAPGGTNSICSASNTSPSSAVGMSWRCQV